MCGNVPPALKPLNSFTYEELYPHTPRTVPHTEDTLGTNTFIMLLYSYIKGIVIVLEQHINV